MGTIPEKCNFDNPLSSKINVNKAVNCEIFGIFLNHHYFMFFHSLFLEKTTKPSTGTKLYPCLVHSLPEMKTPIMERYGSVEISTQLNGEPML